MLIGRKYEQLRLKDAFESKRPEFVAVYGRRRIGKTFLVRQVFGDRMFFRHTGKAKAGMQKQLETFRDSLVQQGLPDCGRLANWGEAFKCLKALVLAGGKGRKVIFIDEMPWMDTPRSGFVSELEYFWNDWASARDDVMLVVCGSATSWIVGKIVRNKGGLHNRLTMQISLQPFTLHECEEYMKARGIELSRADLAELYMVFGGVPYYWSLVRKGQSVARCVDSLIFASGGELELEFDQLYASLFANPTLYLKIVTALGKKKMGLNREEIVAAAKLTNNGILTRCLNDLEQCGFIRRYSMFGKVLKGGLYQLSDPYTLFYFQFVQLNKRKDPRFWSNSFDTAVHATWSGLAFERLCLYHVDQIRQALGISGVKASVAAWRHEHDDKSSGTQIDLLIDRADRVINICEMKYCGDRQYEINDKRARELRERRGIFIDVTGTNRSVFLTLVTPCGVKRNKYCGCIQSEVVLDDLFRSVRDPRI